MDYPDNNRRLPTTSFTHFVLLPYILYIFFIVFNYQIFKTFWGVTKNEIWIII